VILSYLTNTLVAKFNTDDVEKFYITVQEDKHIYGLIGTVSSLLTDSECMPCTQTL